MGNVATRSTRAKLGESQQRVDRVDEPEFCNEVRVERGDEVWLFALRCGELAAEDRVATAAMMDDVEGSDAVVRAYCDFPSFTLCLPSTCDILLIATPMFSSKVSKLRYHSGRPKRERPPYARRRRIRSNAQRACDSGASGKTLARAHKQHEGRRTLRSSNAPPPLSNMA